MTMASMVTDAADSPRQSSVAHTAGTTVLLVLCLTGAAWAQGEVPLEREQVLVRMVRQDCGSCHGMQLTGGLGPALTAQALSAMPRESLAATIYHGRPGTPMPPWKALLSEPEADWIAQRLLEGFPPEQKRIKR